MLGKIQVLKYVYICTHMKMGMRERLQAGRVFVFKGGEEQSVWVEICGQGHTH